MSLRVASAPYLKLMQDQEVGQRTTLETNQLRSVFSKYPELVGTAFECCCKANRYMNSKSTFQANVY